jgi:hypothetical protein
MPERCLRTPKTHSVKPGAASETPHTTLAKPRKASPSPHTASPSPRKRLTHRPQTSVVTRRRPSVTPQSLKVTRLSLSVTPRKACVTRPRPGNSLHRSVFPPQNPRFHKILGCTDVRSADWCGLCCIRQSREGHARTSPAPLAPLFRLAGRGGSRKGTGEPSAPVYQPPHTQPPLQRLSFDDESHWM